MFDPQSKHGTAVSGSTSTWVTDIYHPFVMALNSILQQHDSTPAHNLHIKHWQLQGKSHSYLIFFFPFVFLQRVPGPGGGGDFAPTMVLNIKYFISIFYFAVVMYVYNVHVAIVFPLVFTLFVIPLLYSIPLFCFNLHGPAQGITNIFHCMCTSV